MLMLRMRVMLRLIDMLRLKAQGSQLRLNAQAHAHG